MEKPKNERAMQAAMKEFECLAREAIRLGCTRQQLKQELDAAIAKWEAAQKAAPPPAPPAPERHNSEG